MTCAPEGQECDDEEVKDHFKVENPNLILVPTPMFLGMGNHFKVENPTRRPANLRVVFEAEHV